MVALVPLDISTIPITALVRSHVGGVLLRIIGVAHIEVGHVLVLAKSLLRRMHGISTGSTAE